MTLRNMVLDDLEMTAGIAHTADFLRRYPGEGVTFFTRVDVAEHLLKFRLRVTIPNGLELVDFQAQDQPEFIPIITRDDENSHVIWDIEREPYGSRRFEFRAVAQVLPASEDKYLLSKAVITTQIQGEEQVCEEESTSVFVTTKARYLKYMPSIYHDDEIMSRMLMLFESFLAPIDGQIRDGASYYDPKLAPSDFLPWLASWTGLEMDADIPDERKRKLVGSAAALFHERGTRTGMQEFLELSTGGKVKIVEHFSQNFRLGGEAKLGLGIALGTENVPNTFTVNISLPPLPRGLSKKEKKRQEGMREQRIKAIIDREKPVHAGYVLRLTTEAAPDEAGSRE